MIKYRPPVSSQPDPRRRKILKGAAAGTAIMSFPAIVRSADDRKIVCRDPGGPFTPGFAAAYYDDFKKESGITAVGIQGDHEPTGLIKAMVDTKTYTWDCALLSNSSHKVVANGGTIVKDIFSFPGGRRFQFADPNGNELAVWSDRRTSAMT